MSPERAQEILDKARTSEGIGPWVDRLDMTPIEVEMVKAAWSKLSGNTTFVDALRAIAESRVDPYSYYNSGSSLGVVGVLPGEQSGEYTYLSACNPAFTWIRTEDLHTTREAAAASQVARYSR